MSMRGALVLVILAVTVAPERPRAQEGMPDGTPRVSRPPIEAITTASSVSTEAFRAIAGVRELPDGRVLVNDAWARRLVLMDSTLRTVTVVLDSLQTVQNAYGQGGALIPYVADTTLLVDRGSFAMLVLDPAGRLARVRSVWRVQDLPAVSGFSGQGGAPAPDTHGRIVYQVPARGPAVPTRRPGGGTQTIVSPDSAFLVAVDLTTRKLDTLTTLRVPRRISIVRISPEGYPIPEHVIHPLPSTDDWAVLADGTVAVVRAFDYTVDVLSADGRWTRSPRVPYEWQRLEDADKQRMVDSVRAAQEQGLRRTWIFETIRWVSLYGGDYPDDFALPPGFAAPPGLPRNPVLPPGLTLPSNYLYACSPGEEPVISTGAGGGDAGRPSCLVRTAHSTDRRAPPRPVMRRADVVPASDLPDYKPVISEGGSVHADREGNLWVRTVPPHPRPGGPVYDVVTRKGELVRRYQFPPGYSLQGFGAGKVVYLSMRDQSGVRLARVRLR